MKSKVYFTKTITPEKVIEMYGLLGKKLTGNVAAKVHSGEAGNQNYLHPEFWKPIIDYVGGTVVECNTAYDGARNSTEKHKKLMETHGWTKYFDVDLMDAEGPDLKVDIPKGKILSENYLGKNIANYDSMIAKLIVHAPTRKEAIQKMRWALSEFLVDGVETNIDFQLRLLKTEAFEQGTYDNAFLMHWLEDSKHKQS